MVRKKKDHEIASANSHETDSNDLLSKEEQNQPKFAFATNNMGANCPSHDTAPSLNQQYPSASILQWPYALQNNVEQPSSSSKPCVSAQSPSSIALSQWHQLPHSPLNPAGQQGHLLQSTTPFWPHPPPGCHLPGLNVPAIFHPLTAFGSNNASWQAPSVIGGTSSKDQSQVPNFCYQVGYTYPGFAGPWDPSSWWGQVQLSQHPTVYTFPGAHGCLSLQSQPPTVPDCSAPLGLSRKGIIRPAAKLSQKHQQLWEAQSAENVQLWTVIDHLQSEIADYRSYIMKLESEVSSLKQAIQELADYRSCIMKLESEVSSLKQAIQEPMAHVTGTTVSGQASKRGRPRKSVASADALTSPDESQPPVRGRKPKTDIFEKVVLKKAENKVKSSIATAIVEQEGKKVSDVMTKDSNGMGTNGTNVVMPSFNNQVPQELPKMQISGVGLSPLLEMKTNGGDKTGETIDAFAVLTQQAKGIDHRSVLASFLRQRNSGCLGWPYTINSEGSERRNVLNASSKGLYNNDSIISEGGKVIPGWSFAEEEDPSEELEDAVVASAKDDSDDEMGDNGSSDGEEITCSKGENLPQFSNW